MRLAGTPGAFAMPASLELDAQLVTMAIKPENLVVRDEE